LVASTLFWQTSPLLAGQSVFMKTEPDERPSMIPLHHETHFTFRFGEARIIPRFHLEGIEAGRRVAVFRIVPDSGERRGLLATAIVGEHGWVDLSEPIIVLAGDAFVAVPMPS
jgi:hypothetical protein